MHGGMHTIEEENMLPDPEREADFDKAYQKLVQKFYKEQGPNMLIPDEDLNKAEPAKVNIAEKQRKMYEQLQKKEEKLQMMREIQEQKALEGCTFAPERVTKKKQPEEKRDLNKFLEDQKRFEVMR